MVDVDKLTNRSECTRLVDITRGQNRKFLPGSKILYIMLECSSYHRLLDYEKKFHAAGMDTMNRPN